MIFCKNLFERAPAPHLQKNVHLLKQVEQVKTARKSAAIAQQNAVQGCDPASFGPRRDVK